MQNILELQCLVDGSVDISELSMFVNASSLWVYYILT